METPEIEIEAPADDKIVFYCKECKSLTEARRIGKKYIYKCGECNSKQVGFGTYRSVKEYYMR